MSEFADFRDLLREELLRRCRKNPSYSTRALARDLGVSAPFLSQVLSRKRALSEERAYSIAERAGWEISQRKIFTTLVRFEAARDQHNREEILQELRKLKLKGIEFFDLKIDSFKLVSDWYHFAILELTTIKGFVSDSRWIARRLGISLAEASSAVARLRRLGLLEKTASGRFRKTRANYTTNDVPSEAIRRFHRQILERATQALETQGVESRDFSAATFATDPARLKSARELTRKYRRELMQLMESGETPARAVYQLSIQLFRLDGGTE